VHARSVGPELLVAECIEPEYLLAGGYILGGEIARDVLNARSAWRIGRGTPNRSSESKGAEKAGL
jgi:hypothetical protein